MGEHDQSELHCYRSGYDKALKEHLQTVIAVQKLANPSRGAAALEAIQKHLRPIYIKLRKLTQP